MTDASQGLAGMTVVVIGGTSGIGEAVAGRAIAAGAKVVVGGRDPDRLAKAQERLGSAAVGHCVDITQRDSVSRFFAQIPALDHLVVTAGDIHSGGIREMDPDSLRPTMETRFWGVLYAVKAALPRLSSTGSVTLTSGTNVLPRVPGSLGGAVLAAVEGAVGQLAAQLAPIRVNAVRLSAISTPLTVAIYGSREKAEEHLRERAAVMPLRRFGRPSDVAEAVLFLITNPYTTGVVLPVEGGRALH